QGQGETPLKNICGASRPRDHRRITRRGDGIPWVRGRRWIRAIKAHEPILGAHPPVVDALGGLLVSKDFGEQALGNAGRRAYSPNEHQVFRTREDKRVAVSEGGGLIAIARNPLCRLARDTRDAVAPPKSKETVAMPGTVSESELRLKTVAARREGN